jgi:hypothetical protein
MKLKKVVLIVLSIVLMLSFSGCTVINDDALNESDGTVKEFTFTAVLPDGTEKIFELKSDLKTVGDVLIKEGIISGEKGAYGLYIKKVCDITLDDEKDKMYWAFYVNGSYATNSVDKTKIEEGFKYSFKAEKI